MAIIGAKGGHYMNVIGSKGSSSATHGSKHGARFSHSRTPLYSVVSGPGRGDLGAGSAPASGNTSNAVGNAQRDAAPRDFQVTQQAKRRRMNLESTRRNKAE